MRNKLPLTKIKIFLVRIFYKFLSIFLRKSTVCVKRAGINYELDLTEVIDLAIFLFGSYQSHVFKNLNIDRNSRFTVIDIGGNIGSMSLTFASLFPSAEIKAFEPTHFACEKFKKNISLNPLLSNRIELIQSFVSDTNDNNPDITAYASWKVGGQDHAGVKHPVHSGTAMDATGVHACTLDWISKTNGYKNIKLIKIDTDGHEFKVLKGAKEIIIRDRPIIVFEIGKFVMKEHHVDNFFFFDFFETINYDLFNSHNLKKVTRNNWNKTIPELSTIDIIAAPGK